MNNRQMKENINKLMDVLDSYADTPEAKQCVKYFKDDNQTTLTEQTLELVNAIHDGLAYGNWPWVIKTLNHANR